jgi:hypothetical protein
LKAVVIGLTERAAATDAAAEDERLRGRTYTIPFDTVWQASLRLMSGGIRGWALGRADDRAGVIVGLARTPVFKKEADVRIRIGLDRIAQTRVDLHIASRTERRGDLGRSRRLVGRFLKRLDRELQARPEQILDPTALAEYRERM